MPCCRDEFQQYVAKKEKVVQRTFAKLDVDNSGYIDADELVNSCLSPHLKDSAGRQESLAGKLKHRPQVLVRRCLLTMVVWPSADL